MLSDGISTIDTVEQTLADPPGPVMHTPPVASPKGRPPPTLQIGQRSYPVLLPKLGDPRLATAATLLTVQVLGQVTLGFDLSITQILASIGTCAVIEVIVRFRREQVIAWPASAMLTGNGIALLTRATGTTHGEWWSTTGLGYFVLIAVLSMGSKYLIRLEDRHLFNPSNLGLVAAFLVLGSERVNPEDLWWGDIDLGLAATFGVLLCGGIWVTRRLGLLEMAVAFWLVFAVGMGVLALDGHQMEAAWSMTPIEGRSFWWILVSSPEILIFMMFMITDPRTVPSSRRGRLVFGASIGLVATLLVAPQHTEFATKVAILGALTVVTAAWPLLQRSQVVATAARWMAGGAPGAVGRQTVLAITSTVLTVGASVLISVPAESGTGTAMIADRPVIEGIEDDLPEVMITPAARRLNGSVDSELAGRVARDVAIGLQLEEMAVEQRDEQLLAAAGTGERLEWARRELSSGNPSGVLGRRYQFESLILDVIQESPQSVPSFGLRARGSSSSADEAGDPMPFDTTFVLALVDEHYLIASAP